MATIIIFGSSLVVVSALLLMKAIELRYGKKCVILRLLGHLDPKSEKLISGIKFKTLQVIQSVQYVVLVEAKSVCKNLLDKVEQKIMDEYLAKQSSIMMGKKNITNRGSVSFYLKKITDNRGAGARGKIE